MLNLRLLSRRLSKYWLSFALSSVANAVLGATGLYPGISFVGILPGHVDATFVRKKRVRRKSTFGISNLLGSRKKGGAYCELDSQRLSYIPRNPPAQPADSTLVERTATIASPQRPSVTRDTILTYRSPSFEQLERRRTQGGEGRRNSDMNGRHTCGHCGKYRSANYHKRHPLAVGEWPRPSICTSCAKDKTSSEGSSGSQPGYRRKRRRHRSRSLVSLSSEYSYGSWISGSDESDSTRIHTIIASTPSSVVSRRNSRRRTSTRGVRLIGCDEGSEESLAHKYWSRGRSRRR